MGWLYPYHTTTKKSLIADVLSTWKNDNSIVHATKSTKSGLWMLVSTPKESAPVIVLYLMEKGQGLWGYKDLDESCHPYYYDCPIEWLKVAPEVNAEWRKGVIAYHQKKKETSDSIQKIIEGKTYNVGGMWKLHGRHITSVLVTSVKPYRGASYGDTFRLPRKMLADMVEV